MSDSNHQVDLEPGIPFHELEIADVIDETPDARSFVFRIPETLADAFRYRAGQFLTFKIPWGEFELSRCYSLASAPEGDEPHKVTVKRVDDGRVSNWFNDKLAAGDRIQVRPPAGQFVLKERETPLLLFGGGSGITPVISLLKSALATTRRRIKLVYANRDPRSVIFRAELDRLAAAHADRVEVVHWLDSERGFMDAAAVATQLAGWEDADIYICGPAAFMDTVEDALDARQTPRARIFIERFVSAVDPDRRPAQPAAEAADAGAPGEERCESFQLTFEGQTHTIPIEPGETLLAAAKRAGIEPPYSCEEGYCSCCMAKLVAGRVQMRVNDALSARDLDRGYVLACQSEPRTAEIHLDYDG